MNYESVLKPKSNEDILKRIDKKSPIQALRDLSTINRGDLCKQAILKTHPTLSRRIENSEDERLKKAWDIFLNDVMLEVDKVYETRWDCEHEREGVPLIPFELEPPPPPPNMYISTTGTALFTEGCLT